jgi:hypothetical protein
VCGDWLAGPDATRLDAMVALRLHCENLGVDVGAALGIDLDEVMVAANLPHEECVHCGERPPEVCVQWRPLDGTEDGQNADRYLCRPCATEILAWV